MRILILGGTTEASELARRLARDARFAPTVSLAGRTAAPAAPPVPYRVGGFGGVDGLVQWLTDEKVEAIVDATHPFATQISANASAASQRTGVPSLTVVRPAWEPKEDDRWIDVDSIDDAVAALGDEPRRVFLTVGRLELEVFKGAPHHTYLIRTIDAPAPSALPPSSELILERGPFDEVDERRLLKERAIDVVVTKNSGGNATYGKIAAARALGLCVVMVARPSAAAGNHVPDAAAAYDWLVALKEAHHAGVSSDRGV